MQRRPYGTGAASQLNAQLKTMAMMVPPPPTTTLEKLCPQRLLVSKVRRMAQIHPIGGVHDRKTPTDDDAGSQPNLL